MSHFRLLWLCAATALLSCKGGAPESDPPAATTAPATAPADPPPPPEGIPIPSGPMFAILRGEGIGPIRFGATVQTVERHMDLPCEIREENLCRYVGRAAEFLFDASGGLMEIRLHRVHRPAPGTPYSYGMFNGRFPEGVQFAMLRHAIRELLGEPKHVQSVTEGGPSGTVEVFHYDDMRLEFDQVASGDVVLGGVTLLRPAVSAPKPAP
jgi:hypothetical protein